MAVTIIVYHRFILSTIYSYSNKIPIIISTVTIVIYESGYYSMCILPIFYWLSIVFFLLYLPHDCHYLAKTSEYQDKKMSDTETFLVNSRIECI